MRKSYDSIVVGAGAFGAWTAYHLRRSGLRVALLDAYGPGNSRASSGGETRVIRMGYGPDELYTEWAARALIQWKNLAGSGRQELFHKTGVLWLSSETDIYAQQTLTALRQRKIACRELSAAELREQYPQFSFHSVQRGVLEPDSGVLMAREAVQALARELAGDGVDLFRAQVLPVTGAHKLDQVQTSAGERFSAGSFVFACGAWLPKVFPDVLQGRIRSSRQEVFFLGVPSGEDAFSAPKAPVWLHHTHPKRPYALPDIANRGLKFAFDRHGPDFDPDAGSRLITDGSVAELREYLQENIPRLQHAPIVESRVCQYENTSNGDFLVDRHPCLENVWLAGGGSGHGFKHGPVLGEHVRDLVLGKAAVEPRFSLATKQITAARAVF
ncbi:MAG TPA: FAD-dependent oxidoreductase [Terriglobales bacterium]|nr:FAD-dependent oxidoreductase [Terriglobales bacterium]